MMKKITFTALVGGLCGFLSACGQSGKPDAGPADSRIILKTMGNGLMGNAMASLAPVDRKQALEAEYKALEYTDAGKNVSWTSRQQAGTAGIVTPGQPYQVGSQNCRQYSHSYTINSVPQTVRGSACRNANGSWSPLI